MQILMHARDITTDVTGDT